MTLYQSNLESNAVSIRNTILRQNITIFHTINVAITEIFFQSNSHNTNYETFQKRKPLMKKDDLSVTIQNT